MAFTTAAGLLYDPLKAVANLQAMLQEGVAASQRLFPILDNKPKIISPDKPEDIKKFKTAKVFDIVLAMTNGQWGTEVLANLMFDWMFRGGGDSGRGSTIALFIMLGVIPIMIWNLRRFKMEQER